MLHLAEDMDHINYKLYSDLINPLTEFLNTIKFYAHKSTAPKLPTALFRDPTTTEWFLYIIFFNNISRNCFYSWCFSSYKNLRYKYRRKKKFVTIIWNLYLL